MKRYTLFKPVFIAVMGLCLISSFILAGCTQVPPTKDEFEFVLLQPTTSVACGERVVYSSELVNQSDACYTLSHADPLIILMVCEASANPPLAVGTVLIESELKKGEKITKDLTVEFTEPGDYKLIAACSYFIGDAEYFYELEPVVIHVSE